VHQVGKINLAAPRPFAPFTHDYVVRVVEQDLRVQLLGETALHRRLHQPGKNQINLALEELGNSTVGICACSTRNLTRG
jgi:hypothetical protein